GVEKLVALKVLRPDLAEDPEFVTLFSNETLVAMTMSHTNVVQSFDAGCFDGHYFIAMELVNGIKLANLLRSMKKHGIERMPIDLGLTVAVESLKGLDYAHRLRDSERRPLGIIHRDISPANILISYEGEVKLADFGIAKSTLGTVRTETGSLKGK